MSSKISLEKSWMKRGVLGLDSPPHPTKETLDDTVNCAILQYETEIEHNHHPISAKLFPCVI